MIIVAHSDTHYVTGWESLALMDSIVFVSGETKEVSGFVIALSSSDSWILINTLYTFPLRENRRNVACFNVKQRATRQSTRSNAFLPYFLRQ
jgi:hypothetical protein